MPISLALLWLLVLSFATTRGSTGHALAGWAADDTTLRTGEAAEAALSYLRRAPLDSLSYLVLGQASERTGSNERAEELVRRSAEIDPRLAPARLWLTYRYLGTGRLEPGIREVIILNQLRRSYTPQLQMVLAEASKDARARAIIARRFANTPEILDIARLGAAAGLEVNELRELLAPTNLRALPQGVATAQTILVEELLRQERFREAYSTWYALSGAAPATAVFDGGFIGLEGSPPFGWSLTHNANVEAAILPSTGPNGSGALAIQTFGSLASRISEQSLMLAPGRYRLSYAAAVPPSERQLGNRTFFWTVKCRSGALLLEAFIATPSIAWSIRSHAFDVPDNCPMQILALQKNSTPYANAQRLRISSVAVSR